MNIDFDPVRLRVARVRSWALEMLDAIPALRRFADELVRVQIIDRAMVIAAQGLLALVPLLIVLAAFLPADLGSFVLDRFQNATGVGSQSDTMHATVTTDQVRAQTGVAGVLLTVFSATSFARAIQRMYERVWAKKHIGGVTGARRCFVWLAGWMVLLQMVSFLGSQLTGNPAVALLRFLLQLVGGSLLWWWSARMLLLERVGWRHLLPGALITGVATTLYSRGSGLVMPHYAESSANQLGTLGLVLTVTTWLIGFAFVMVVAAIAGRVLVEDERLHDFLLTTLTLGRSAGLRARSRAGRATRRRARQA